jgi:mono/diheme cytochrome c family protein
MTQIRTIRRLGGILTGIISTLAVSLTVSPAAFAHILPPSGGGGAPPEAHTQIRTIVTGGMPGWQITLIAVAAALVAATLAVTTDRVLAQRRVAASSA